MSSREQLLTPDQVAYILNVPKRLLASWRYFKKGPAYIKVGGGVRYKQEDIDKWIQESQHDPQ